MRQNAAKQRSNRSKRKVNGAGGGTCPRLKLSSPLKFGLGTASFIFLARKIQSDVSSPLRKGTSGTGFLGKDKAQVSTGTRAVVMMLLHVPGGAR